MVKEETTTKIRRIKFINTVLLCSLLIPIIIISINLYNNSFNSTKKLNIAAKSYIASQQENIEWTTTSSGVSYTYIFLDELEKDGYIDKKIKTNSKDKIIKVERDKGNGYKYQVIKPSFDQTVSESLKVHYDGIMNTLDGHKNTTIWKDLSNNGSDVPLTDFKDPWTPTGLKFNGISNAFVTKPIQFESSQLTISFSIKDYIQPPETSSHQVLFESSSSYEKNRNNFRISYGNDNHEGETPTLQFAFSGESGNYLIYSIQDQLEDNVLITMVFDSAKVNIDERLKVYVGGIQTTLKQNQDDSGKDYNSSDMIQLKKERLYVGARNKKSNFFKGTIENIKVYNRALNYREVQVNHKIDKNRFQDNS